MTIVIVIERDHLLEPPCFVFLVVEITALPQSGNFVTGVFDLIELLLSIHVFLAGLELLYLLTKFQNCFEILNNSSQLFLLPIDGALVLNLTHIVESDHSFFINVPLLLLVKAILHKYFIYLLLFLRMEQTVFDILEVGVSVYPQQVNRGWLTLLFI
jgi:hypothetical protein